MFKLKKCADKDFTVLNLTDTQLSAPEWRDGDNCRYLIYTVKELVKRVNPDLITISGDLAWAKDDKSYDCLADFLDSFKIPWAPVWGNHDNQEGPEYIESLVERYHKHPYFLYESGPRELGNGNFVIAVTEGEKVVSAIIMMDSHDRMPCDISESKSCWAMLTQEQLNWYRKQVELLSSMGCNDSVLLMHIPCYAYREASKSAYKLGLDLRTVTVEESEGTDVWNEGYENSVGVQYEGVCSSEYDDGVLDVLHELGSTRYVIAGHDHVNNWMITYKGIRLIYALKCGCGCYWHPRLNGGTVLKIDRNGVREARHEYVDISHLLPKE